MPQHPMQPIVEDQHGCLRFQRNAVVEHLLEVASRHGCSLNELALMSFSDEDRAQLAQLIGYSISGYSELSYVSDEAADAAQEYTEYEEFCQRCDTARPGQVRAGGVVFDGELYTVHHPEEPLRPGMAVRCWVDHTGPGGRSLTILDAETGLLVAIGQLHRKTRRPRHRLPHKPKMPRYWPASRYHNFQSIYGGIIDQS